jgi:hypothetical protein
LVPLRAVPSAGAYPMTAPSGRKFQVGEYEGYIHVGL